MSRTCHRPILSGRAKIAWEVDLGRLQSIGKRVALQLAALVARNELFERYGDRPVQPPLGPDDWSHDGGESSTADDGSVEQAIIADDGSVDDSCELR